MLTANHCRCLAFTGWRLWNKRRWVELLPRNLGWLVFLSNSQVIRSVNKLFFRLRPPPPPPTAVLSFLLFRVRTLLSYYIQPFSCSHGTYSHSITVIHSRSYFRPSISSWIPNSHQIRFFFIPCYAPNRPRLLDGNYLSRIRIVNRWALTIRTVANHWSTWRTRWQHSRSSEHFCKYILQ